MNSAVEAFEIFGFGSNEDRTWYERGTSEVRTRYEECSIAESENKCTERFKALFDFGGVCVRLQKTVLIHATKGILFENKV